MTDKNLPDEVKEDLKRRSKELTARPIELDLIRQGHEIPAFPEGEGPES